MKLIKPVFIITLFVVVTYNYFSRPIPKIVIKTVDAAMVVIAMVVPALNFKLLEKVFHGGSFAKNVMRRHDGIVTRAAHCTCRRAACESHLGKPALSR